MKGSKLLVMGLALIMSFGTLLPMAAAESDSLHVVMAIDDLKYSPGDTISIRLMVYDSGAPKDLAAISGAYLGMSQNYDFSNPLDISLTDQGTGVYQGQYTVKAGDANHNLYFFYRVTSGNDYEEGHSRVTVYTIQDTVDVTIGGQKSVPARSGDILEARVLVRTGPTPIPVSGFTHLYLETPTGQRQNLTHTEVEVGIYSVQVSLPTVSVSGGYRVFAQPMGIGDSDSAYIHINVLEVWCHKISATGDAVSFELCVADAEGKAIQGASFQIERNEWPHDSHTGTTNASGKSLIHVTNLEGDASYSGFVHAAGLNQTIDGMIFNRIEEQPHHSSFDIICESEDRVFAPKADVTIQYGAYSSRAPASMVSIYYYVTARGADFPLLGGPGHLDVEREVISSGALTTDALGKFSIAFKTPAKQAEISVRIEVPLSKTDFVNQSYDLDDDLHYEAWPQSDWDNEGFIFRSYEGKLDGSGSVSIKLGSFKPGKPGKVTVSLDSELGDPVAAFWSIGPGTLEGMDSYDPEWVSWVPAGNVIQLQEDDKGKLQGEFLVPEFITGQDVTVAAGYSDDGVPRFDLVTESPGSGIPWLWIGVIVIIIVVVIVAIVIVGKQQMWF